MPKRTWVASSATPTTPSGCIRASATCRRSSSKTTTFAPEGVDFAGGSVLGVQSTLLTVKDSRQAGPRWDMGFGRVWAISLMKVGNEMVEGEVANVVGIDLPE